MSLALLHGGPLVSKGSVEFAGSSQETSGHLASAAASLYLARLLPQCGRPRGRQLRFIYCQAIKTLAWAAIGPAASGIWPSISERDELSLLRETRSNNWA